MLYDIAFVAFCFFGLGLSFMTAMTLLYWTLQELFG